jgi:hypothetical protein
VLAAEQPSNKINYGGMNYDSIVAISGADIKRVFINHIIRG